LSEPFVACHAIFDDYSLPSVAIEEEKNNKNQKRKTREKKEEEKKSVPFL
jgi:hypothetical protein